MKEAFITGITGEKGIVDTDLELLMLVSPGEGCKILENCHGPWHRWKDRVIGMEK